MFDFPCSKGYLANMHPLDRMALRMYRHRKFFAGIAIVGIPLSFVGYALLARAAAETMPVGLWVTILLTQLATLLSIGLLIDKDLPRWKRSEREQSAPPAHRK